MSRHFSQIVIRVYPNGVPREGPDGVEFHFPDPVVFMMCPVETLIDLQEDDPKEYEASGAYTGVRAMFTSHGRILADQVIDL
ncbi:hypothetical protein PIB30_016433 [Stylosanthes scabra]|uniref:Uncharacterized protein n=1 Tax=Stylosanthes scabra TaxID=79078 RepID=A0ABU6W5B5_9FABA|nr:hypothetical protein [Stylosanthes scabra]